MASAPVPIDAELQAAYLRRLGLEVEPPSVDALQRLHRAQVERVPYETMWIHAGEAWGIDVTDSVERIALQGRGGYCFHLNGAFGALLRSLGYAVTRHVGGVHGPDGPDEALLTNHLVLTVSGLPTSENPSGTWYVDAGLGDALHEALPLAAGEYEQAPIHLVLDETPGGVGDWHLTHDPAGGFAGMSWRAAEATLDDFSERHRWLSTSPDSGFVRVATAQRRDATGTDIMRGLVLSRVGDGAASAKPLTARDDWFAALADIFGLRLDGTPPAALDRLWERSVAAHRAWEAGGTVAAPAGAPSTVAAVQDEDDHGFPAGFFDRADATDDAWFYEAPRLVTHIDDAAIAAVGELYEELRIGGDVLDLMSSWVSHFRRPPHHLRVLGMSEAELTANPVAAERIVHDLNADPCIPLAAETVDDVVCCVSVDYLTQPVEVFRDVARILRPGGRFVCTFSNRVFPTKAIRAWLQATDADRLAIVAEYFRRSRAFETPTAARRTPKDHRGDPLYAVWAARADQPQGGGAPFAAQ